MLINWKSVQAK